MKKCRNGIAGCDITNGLRMMFLLMFGFLSLPCSPTTHLEYSIVLNNIIYSENSVKDEEEDASKVVQKYWHRRKT